MASSRRRRNRQFNASRLKGRTDAKRSLLSPELTDLTQMDRVGICPYCWHEYKRQRANQVFCCPSHKSMYCEKRKAALVTALAEMMRSYGTRAEAALHKAQDTIDIYFRRVMTSMLTLGYWYDEKARKWEFGSLKLETRRTA